MKGTDNKKQIRRDCLSYMKGVAAAQFLVDLAGVLIPTLTASVFGEMINALLQASYAQACSLLPSFILYMGLSVLTVPFFTMVEFLCMGKRGYDYDMFMVKRLLRKPLSEIQQYNMTSATFWNVWKVRWAILAGIRPACSAFRFQSFATWPAPCSSCTGRECPLRSSCW